MADAKRRRVVNAYTTPVRSTTSKGRSSRR